MISAQFEYAAPTDVHAAAALLASGNAQALSGGSSLIAELKKRRTAVSLVVDLKRIPTLSEIKVQTEERTLRIGATATFSEIFENQDIVKYCPLLAQTAGCVAYPQVRNRKSLGGCIAANDYSGEIWAALLLSGALIRIMNAEKSMRTVAATEFFRRDGRSALMKGDIITAVDIPFQDSQASTAYIKQSDPASGKTICGVGVAATVKQAGVIDRCEIAVVGATALPMRLGKAEEKLAGLPVNKENIAAVWNAVRGSLQFAEDFSATAEYRDHLTGIFLQRALMKATEENNHI